MLHTRWCKGSVDELRLSDGVAASSCDCRCCRGSAGRTRVMQTHTHLYDLLMSNASAHTGITHVSPSLTAAAIESPVPGLTPEDEGDPMLP